MAREVRLQSLMAKGGSFLDDEDVCWSFLAGIRVCFSFDS